MNSQLTDITLVIDRSGSMASIREDAEGGVNSLLQQQAGEPGEATVTIVQFDTEYEFVCQGTPVESVPTYQLEPRGATALLDAVGQAINQTGKRLEAMPENQRPGLVIFVIVTDGHENSSQEFTLDQIKSMIEHQQQVYNWHFNFLGADQDAFEEAAKMGIHLDGAAVYSKDRVAATYGAVGKKMTRMRNAVAFGAAPDNAFTDEEREEMQ